MTYHLLDKADCLENVESLPSFGFALGLLRVHNTLHFTCNGLRLAVTSERHSECFDRCSCLKYENRKNERIQESKKSCQAAGQHFKRSNASSLSSVHLSPRRLIPSLSPSSSLFLLFFFSLSSRFRNALLDEISIKKQIFPLFFGFQPDGGGGKREKKIVSRRRLGRTDFDS